MFPALGAVAGAGAGGGLSNQRSEDVSISSSAKSQASFESGGRTISGQHGPIITVAGGDAKVNPSASTNTALPWILGGVAVVVVLVAAYILRK